MEKKIKLPKEVFDKIHECIADAGNLDHAQSAKMADVALELCEYIDRQMVKKPKTFAEQFRFFVTNALKGFILYSMLYSLMAFLLWIGFSLWCPVTYVEAFGIFLTLRMIKIAVLKLPTDLHIKNDDKSKKD